MISLYKHLRPVLTVMTVKYLLIENKVTFFDLKRFDLFNFPKD